MVNIAAGQIVADYDLISLTHGLLFMGAKHVDGTPFDRPERRPRQLQIPLRRANARHTGFEDSLRHEEPGKQCAPWRSTDVSCPDPWKRACLIPYERGSIVEACRAAGSS
jgi:hypothetical protein